MCFRLVYLIKNNFPAVHEPKNLKSTNLMQHSIKGFNTEQRITLIISTGDNATGLAYLKWFNQKLIMEQ